MSYWVAHSAADCDDEDSNPKKLKRVKSFQWLVVTESMLKHVFGVRKGWLDFHIREKPEDPLPPNPRSWPSISVVIDQGPDGWCAGNFLVNHMGVNACILKDGSRRGWNDVCLALKGSKQWFLVLAFAVVCNCDHGPWRDSRWYTESKEAAETYLQVASATSCPLFQEFYPQLLNDKGDSLANSDDELLESTWKQIPEAFATKLPKLSRSRWFGIFDSVDELHSIWHSRLLVLLFICLSEGWVQNSKLKTAKLQAKMNNAFASDMDKEPTGKESEEIRVLKRSCQNNLHFCATLLGDIDHQRILRGLVTVAGPIRLVLGTKLRNIRSVDGTLKHYKIESRGCGMTPLNAVVKDLLSKGLSHNMGISFESPKDFDFDVEHPRVLSDFDVPGKVADFVCRLLSLRLKEVFWHTDGYPGSFAKQADPELAQGALQTLERDCDIWMNDVASMTGPYWNKYKKRSVFHTMAVQQVVEQAKIDRFRPSISLHHIVTVKFTTAGGTKFVEDAFKIGRDEERAGGNANLEMTQRRFFDKLIKTGLISDLRKYEEVPWQSAAVPRGHEYLPAKHYFTPKAKRASKQLKGVISKSIQPPWYSPAPANQCQQDACILVARHCKQHSLLSKVESSWLCTLFRGLRLLVRCKSRGQSPEWAFAIGSLAGSVALVWPAAQQKFGKVKCYTMGVNAKPSDTLRYVFDLSVWEAMEYDWVGYSGVHCLMKTAHVVDGFGCVAVPRGEKNSLFKTLVLAGFRRPSERGFGPACEAHRSAVREPGPALRTASEAAALRVARQVGAGAGGHHAEAHPRTIFDRGVLDQRRRRRHPHGR